MDGSSVADWVSVLEVPIFLTSVVMAFLTARALRGGIFGIGMLFLAVSFLIMAAGHASMFVERIADVDPFHVIFGRTLAPYAWALVLILTWAVSAIALYRIYRAAKGS